jgi:ABC-2 type transport system permease protein
VIPERLGWVPHALSLEIRKVLSYRVDFWAQLLGAVFTELGMAYFLWKSVYASQGVERIGGYSFGSMMLYYLLIPLTARMIRGDENRFISDEIYEGGLTRFLVYPLPFLGYKYLTQLASALLGVLQLGIGLAIFAWTVGFPPELDIGAGAMMQGLVAGFAASVLYFFIAACIEMVSFWQDSVWSLMVMVRFVMLLSGGGLVPLALFPDWAHALLERLPFAYLISFPIRCFMGGVAMGEWWRGLGMIVLWTLGLAIIARWIWIRGTRQYSGVGL